LADRGGAPLLNPALFRNRPFTVGLLIALVFMQVPAAFLLMVTFFLQIGLGFSPLLAGLVTAAFSIGTLLASFASVPVKQRVQRPLGERERHDRPSHAVPARQPAVGERELGRSARDVVPDLCAGPSPQQRSGRPASQLRPAPEEQPAGRRRRLASGRQRAAGSP